jgi:hypothetical protein
MFCLAKYCRTFCVFIVGSGSRLSSEVRSATLPFPRIKFSFGYGTQVEGNPMKTIRRDILARGTAGLLKYLRSRHIS